MAHLIQHVNPQLADVRCSRITFQPGDCVLVRAFVAMDEERKRKLRKQIERWAGCEIKVLIYDGREMEIDARIGTGPRILLP